MIIKTHKFLWNILCSNKKSSASGVFSDIPTFVRDDKT